MVCSLLHAVELIAVTVRGIVAAHNVYASSIVRCGQDQRLEYKISLDYVKVESIYAVHTYYVGRTIRRAHNLQCNEYNINQLTQEHASQCAELEQTNSRVTQVKSIHAKHSQEHGE